jgi:phenylpropionate dioxygenase-like ring-hydroxylating dioxygenase large terminal subunit
MPESGVTDGNPSIALGSAATTDATFGADVAQLLLSSWQLVCHESDLPAPGTAIRFDFCGRSALLLRRPDAGIAGFANVCRHRGSRLVDGDVATGLAFCIDGKIRCPAHGWVYTAAGALDLVPRESAYERLDRGALALAPLRVNRVGPWVFVSFAADERAEPDVGIEWLSRFEPSRAHALRRLAEPRLWGVDANWRIVCADALDLPALGSQATALPLEPTTLEVEIGDQSVSVSAQLRGAASTWSASRYLGCLGASADPAAARWCAGFIWPNLWLEVSADQWTVTQALPVSPRRTLLREISYGLKDTTRRTRVVRYLHRRLLRRHAASRTRRLERLQAGLAGSTLPEPAPLAADDLGLEWFTRRLRVGSSPD